MLSNSERFHFSYLQTLEDTKLDGYNIWCFIDEVLHDIFVLYERVFYKYLNVDSTEDLCDTVVVLDAR